MRSNQLVLIDTASADFRIDDRTRSIGREGIAAARAALLAASVAAVVPAASDRKAA